VRIDRDVTVIGYGADTRGGYIVKCADGKRLILSEPAPDVAREYQASLTAAAGLISKVKDVNIAADYSSKVVDLARRSQSLQILREALFRLSEMVANGAVNPGEAKELYDRVLRSVEIIALAELGDSGMPETAQKDAIRSFYSSVKPGNLGDTEGESNKKQPTEGQQDSGGKEGSQGGRVTDTEDEKAAAEGTSAGGLKEKDQ
jgi:hypothetical protein